MMFLTDSVLACKLRLFLYMLSMILIAISVRPASAQSEAEISQDFANYALSHTEDETRAYVASKISQLTTQEYFYDHSLSTIAGFFLDGTDCIRIKHEICDRQYEEALLRLTGESALLAAGCVLITTSNPWAFVACATAVAVRHQAQLEAATRVHQACLLQARLACFPPVVASCIPQPQIVAWCDDYDYSSCICQGTVNKSPIIVDVLGNGFNLTNASDGVNFDITGTGKVERLSWTRAGSDDAFLVLDRNGNGQIDNGLEMFGNFTDQPPPIDGHERNGFWALTGFDSNADGRIDERDAIFPSLRLWQDADHNGVSEPQELHKLSDLGLKTIDLDYRESRKKDENGNRFRYRAKVKDSRDAQLGRWAWDVFLMDR